MESMKIKLQMSFFCLLVKSEHISYLNIPERVCKFIWDTPAKMPKAQRHFPSAHDLAFPVGPQMLPFIRASETSRTDSHCSLLCPQCGLHSRVNSKHLSLMPDPAGDAAWLPQGQRGSDAILMVCTRKQKLPTDRTTVSWGAMTGNKAIKGTLLNDLRTTIIWVFLAS